MLRLVSEIGDFVGVRLQVEELRHVDLRIADQLPAIVANGPLHLAVSQKQRVANARRFALNDRLQTLAVEASGNIGAEEIADGRKNIEQINEGLRFAARNS